MPTYVPNTDADRAAMLARLGLRSIDDLFTDIPETLREPGLDLPSGASELELQRELAALASRNLSVDAAPSFLGAGSYRHFIPSVVGHLTSRSEFATAYTPYQPEISQGTLQTIFEFQTMMCELTGMEVANSGMYDGATALAEAVLMACRVTGRRSATMLPSVSPRWRDVVWTYVQGQDIQVAVAAEPAPGVETACVVVQYPDFFGTITDLAQLAAAAHGAGALLVVAVNPIALGMLTPPGEAGADIVVAEGQPLGQSTVFGGPYVGVFCCREAYIRQMPGRIVGRTTDTQGRTGYVLTLQAREQHIRRERATSNICTSEALVALGSTIYLAWMGPQGLREVAELCYHKTHYLAARITALPGFTVANQGEFFHEFVVRCPVPPAEINRRLLEVGILGGLDVSDLVPGGWLLCCTEVTTREDMDRLVVELSRMVLP